MYGVKQTGMKETIALQLYNHFNIVATHDESSEPEADPIAGAKATADSSKIRAQRES